MAHPTLEYIRGLRKTLETKKAEIVGENPKNIPGSEHDSKPDASAKEPDKETKDQTMVPNTGLTTEGAGDDSKITHTTDLIAGEAALTPTKKPEVTGDADASVPGGKTAEALAAEILTGVNGWFEAKKQAEAQKAAEAKKPEEQKQAEQKQAEENKAEPAKKEAAGTPPAAGTGTAEALITDKGKEPEQTKDVIEPNKKDEVTNDAMKPATGEGSSGETAAAAKSAAEGKEAACGDKKEVKEEECADGKCGKCPKCKAAAEKKTAGALDMELTSDVLAKIAAVMLATEEGTKLAESVLAKAAGAEAAEKTLDFLRAQNDLAQKQAEYKAGQRDALALILKKAQEADAAAAAPAATEGDGGIAEIADTLDAMVEAGEITEDEADQVVVELAQALGGGQDAAPAQAPAAAAAPASEEKKDAPAEEKKEAQAVDPAAAAAAPAGNAAIDATVAVDPNQLDPNSVPQGDLSDITPEDVAGAIDSLVESGEITEDEADQLVQEITGGAGEAGAAGGDVNPEEIATALQEAVAKGEIQPEDVQQVLTELEGVPAPDAAQEAPAGAAAADPAAAGAPTDEPKTAAAKPEAKTDKVEKPVEKTAGAKLLEAIQAARAAKAAK